MLPWDEQPVASIWRENKQEKVVIRKCVTTSVGKAWGKFWVSWKKNQGYFIASEMFLHNLFFSPHSISDQVPCCSSIFHQDPKHLALLGEIIESLSF